MILRPWRLHFGIRDLHFGVLGTRFGDPGSQRDTFWDTCGSRHGFLLILGGFGDRLGDHFGIISVTFSRFASSISKYEPQGADFRRKLFGKSFFVELALPRPVCLFLTSQGGLWDHFGTLWLTFWSLLVTLGALFLIFKGPGDRLEM